MLTNANILPDRYPQTELFLCDIGDVAIKDDMGSMAHPVFSLSKRPDHKVRVYQSGDTILKVQPSTIGRATIYDKDLLIFAVSQLMAAKRQGRDITLADRRLQFAAGDYLTFTNKPKGGRAHKELGNSLDRLAGTRLVTNIETDGIGLQEGAGLIESYRMIYSTNNQRVIAWEVVLSEWLMRAVVANEVLTLHRDYFRLKSSLERRVYEIARKHCGAQPSWKVSLEKLQAKCGSNQVRRNFRAAIQSIADNPSLPEYDIWLHDDMVHFQNRAETARLEQVAQDTATIRLEPDTYNDARAVAPGFDIYALEREWRDWIAMSGADVPRNPDKAFVGFCRAYAQRNS